ncbi:MAG TPA: hypothetical protein V6C84_16620 [Coleofasciculaceae cyanobacterium]|jgi:hypothetical protein
MANEGDRLDRAGMNREGRSQGGCYRSQPNESDSPLCEEKNRKSLN